jgi:hypothetical protein
MDETGIAAGVCTNTRVLAKSSKKKAYTKTPDNREWVSIVECVSARGQKTRCLVIFKGKTLQTSWYEVDMVPDWLYTTSENGWTSNAIGVEWLQKIFIPETTTTDNRYRLLILDGHGSHAQIEFLWICKQHQIELLFLPPHSSHVLQPLDLAPFSSVKSSYRRQIMDLSALDDAAPVKKAQFVRCYHQARQEGLTERVIRSGWRAAGICPYNPVKVLTSSQVTGRPVTPPRRKRPLSPTDSLFQTPKRPHDLHIASQKLRSTFSLPREARVILHKAGKAIGRANTRAAGLEAKITQLNYQLEKLQHKKPKKRIMLNANTQFANIENIKKALDEAAAAKAHEATKDHEREAQKAAAEIAASSLQAMSFEWQLNT